MIQSINILDCLKYIILFIMYKTDLQYIKDIWYMKYKIIYMYVHIYIWYMIKTMIYDIWLKQKNMKGIIQ